MHLTPRDRLLRAIRGEPTDCVAVAPYMYDVAAEICGVKLRDYYTNAQTMAQAQLALYEQVGQDAISVGCDNAYIAEGFGGRVKYELDEIPSIIEPAAKTLADVFDLKVPSPDTDGRMPIMLEAIREVRRLVGDTVAIRSPGTGPFALAAHLIGLQQWLYEIGLFEAGMDDANETALTHAMELATEALIRFGKACADAGADIIHCGDSLASCDVISPQTYRRFALPYEQQVFRAWKAHGVRASLLHICGNNTDVLDLYASTGADVVEIDHKVDMQRARQQIGQRAALMGNLDPVTLLLQGTPETVRRAADECIRQAGTGRRFVLGSGCIVARRTPIDNLRAMVQAAAVIPRSRPCG